MKVLLDSSAWLAHLFQEAGAEQVGVLFDDPNAEISISVLSLPEIYGRLRALAQESQWETVWKTYAALFTHVLPVDETVALQMIQLRTSALTRLPLVDGMIAASAVVHGLTLVHRDPHLASIPVAVLPQIVLPDKM